MEKQIFKNDILYFLKLKDIYNGYLCEIGNIEINVNENNILFDCLLTVDDNQVFEFDPDILKDNFINLISLKIKFSSKKILLHLCITKEKYYYIARNYNKHKQLNFF